MTTVDDIRKRHDPNCSGWCDVAVLLAAIGRKDSALLRARDELEALTGEPQPWIDAVTIGHAPPWATIVRAFARNLGHAIRQDEPDMIRFYATTAYDAMAALVDGLASLDPPAATDRPPGVGEVAAALKDAGHHQPKILTVNVVCWRCRGPYHDPSPTRADCERVHAQTVGG